MTEGIRVLEWITDYVFDYLSTEEMIRSFPGTLSIKNRKRGKEYYYQVVENGKRKEHYIRKADVEQVLARFEKKKQARKHLRELQLELKQWPAQLRRYVRTVLTIAREWNILHLDDETADLEQLEQEALMTHRIPPPAELAEDGTYMRSRGELICAMLAEDYGLDVQYEVPFLTEEQWARGLPPYSADFAVHVPSTGQFYLWEHMGMLESPGYAAHQQQKLMDYQLNGLIRGENLIVTTSGRHLNVRAILWDLMCCGVLHPMDIRRRERRRANRKAKVQRLFPKQFDQVFFARRR